MAYTEHRCESMRPKDDPDLFPPNEDGEIICRRCWDVVGSVG